MRPSASGKGVMFISGHFANWETMPVIAAGQLGYESALVYRPPNNPFVDRWISRQRAKLGPKEQITKGAQGTRRIFTLLRRGKAILMLVDQKTGEGVPAPFFGRDAMTTPAPASLALKLGAILLPASAERIGGAHFHVRISQADRIRAQRRLRTRRPGADREDQPSHREPSCARGLRNGFGSTAAGPARATRSRRKNQALGGSGVAVDQRRVELELKPAKPPMRVRAGGAAVWPTRPMTSPRSSLSPAFAKPLALVQIAGGHAVAVIEQRKPPSRK